MWPPIGKIAAHSAYELFSWYKYLIVSLFFSHLGFWSGSLFLIAHFPDLCLLLLFYEQTYDLEQFNDVIKEKYQYVTKQRYVVCQRLGRSIFFSELNTLCSA